MARKPAPPEDDTEITRQVEMLMQGLTLSDTPVVTETSFEAPKPKRRTLDDMRRLSEHIKTVPVYQRK